MAAHYSFHKNINQQKQTLTLIIRNVSNATNQYIMISEGSCDTEDWSNNGC